MKFLIVSACIVLSSAGSYTLGLVTENDTLAFIFGLPAGFLAVVIGLCIADYYRRFILGVKRSYQHCAVAIEQGDSFNGERHNIY